MCDQILRCPNSSRRAAPSGRLQPILDGKAASRPDRAGALRARSNVANDLTAEIDLTDRQIADNEREFDTSESILSIRGDGVEGSKPD